MTDMTALLAHAAEAAHQHYCPHCEPGHRNGCAGPSEVDTGVAAVVLETALNMLGHTIKHALWVAVRELEHARRPTEPVEVTGNDPATLLTEWFRWWRDTDEGPVKLPAALHVRTAAALAAQAVADGRPVRGPQDL